jgi:archaellin
MASRYLIFLTSVLILFILAAGCTESYTETPPVQTLSTLPALSGTGQPGQALQVIGDVTGNGIPGGTIDTITFTLGLVDVHKSVDIENLSIVYADAIRTETLHPVAGYHGDPPKGFWGIIRVENEVGSPNDRLEYEERFVIRINPTAPLVPRQMITIDVKPSDSSSLVIRRVAPPTILADNILPPV